MTYEESNNLMQDLVFRGRIKVAALKYANYILGEPASTTAHNTRVKWAASTQQNPEGVAFLLHPPVVMDAGVQSAGADITDDALSESVETVINQLM